MLLIPGGNASIITQAPYAFLTEPVPLCSLYSLAQWSEHSITAGVPIGENVERSLDQGGTLSYCYASEKRYHCNFVSYFLDGITVTFSDSQAREIRQAIYQGTNCVMAVGNSPDSKEQFTLRWTSDTCASVLEVPTPVRVVQTPRQPSRG